MDPENNFDSDTSESWSLIDINYERSGENKMANNAGKENQSQGAVFAEKSSALTGKQAENGLPGKITKDEAGVASSFTDPKNQQDFQVLYKSKAFGNSGAATKSEPNVEEGEKIDGETKELDEDTDGISVISESEYNDIKAANYESDEGSDDKQSDSDGGENENSNVSSRKKKAKLNQGESSEDTMNTRPRRSILSSVLNIIMGIVFAVVACIAIGHFLGVHDSQEAASSMVQALKKLQTENFMLHSRLRQISEAVFGKPNEGHEMMGRSLPCEDHDADCIRAELAKPENRVGEDDKPLSFFRHRDNIDLSIPLHHPKNLVILQEILSGNEVLVLRKPDEPVEPFNLTKYIKDLIRAQQIKYDDPKTMGKATGFLKYFRPSSKKRGKAGENGKILGPDDKGEKKALEKSNGKHCQKVGSKVEGGETPKENCLAIREKDLSEFRWFLLNGKPKCSETEIQNGENGCATEYLYQVPLDQGYYKQNGEGLDDLKTIIQKHNALMGRKREPKPTPNDKSVGYLFPTKPKDDIDEYGNAKLRQKYLKFPKLKNGKEDLKPRKLIGYEGEKKPKPVGFEVVRKDHFLLAGEFTDKYLKYFKTVQDDIKKNNGKMKECVLGDDGKCEGKSKKKKESNSPPKENRNKKREKRAKDDVGRKREKKDLAKKDQAKKDQAKKDRAKKDQAKKDQAKKDQAKKDQDGKKGTAKSRPKKWKTCSKPSNVKPSMKCGNESRCANCSSKSGDWFSKWAEGRERCRRDQKISEWQFERAKGRAHSRAGDAFWQFSRAYGRQSRRMYPYTRKRKDKQYPRKGYNFKSHSWE